MFDPIDTADQEPTLSQLEEVRVEAEFTRRRRVESLMASEDMPDIDELLEQIVNRPWWHRWAACRGVGTELFFPERGSGRPVEALGYCQQCEVRQECLVEALSHGVNHAQGVEALSHGVNHAQGVWGGTSVRERRQMRQRSVRDAQASRQIGVSPPSPVDDQHGHLRLAGEEVATRQVDGYALQEQIR